MVYPDTDEIRELRREFDFFGSWDVALAVPYEESEGVTLMHRKFYEGITRSIESIGRSCFLPHRDLNQGLREGNPISVLMEIVVPTCDLLLYHASMGKPGGTSHAMICAANCGYVLGKREEPIWFIEEEGYEELHEPSELNVITFSNHLDGIRKIREAVQEYYSGRGINF